MSVAQLDSLAAIIARQWAALARVVGAADSGGHGRVFAASAQQLNSLVARQSEARIELDRGFCYVNGYPARMGPETRLALADLEGRLRRKSIGGFRLRGAVDGGAIIALFRLLTDEPDAGSIMDRQERLDRAGGRVLELLPPRQVLVSAAIAAAQRARSASALTVWTAAALAISAVAAEAGGTVGSPELLRALGSLADLVREDPVQVQRLLALREPMRPPTGSALRTVLIVLLLGNALGMDRGRLTELALVGVMSALWCPEGTHDERVAAVVRSLAGRGADVMSSRRALALFDQAPAVGRGAHLYGRILGVAREYERMTSGDGDSPPMLPEEAYSTMQGGAVDRELLAMLARVLGRYPLGTGVRLDSGELALVYHPPTDPTQPTRPVVRLRSGQENGKVVDLADTAGGGRQVVEGVDPRTISADLCRALFR